MGLTRPLVPHLQNFVCDMINDGDGYGDGDDDEDGDAKDGDRKASTPTGLYCFEHLYNKFQN